MDIKKILFPTDFSIFSEKAFIDAVEQAKRNNAELILLHVIEIQSAYDMYGTAFIPGFFYDKFDDMRTDSEKRLSEMASRYPDVKMKIIIKEGTAFEEILNTEKEENVDLVIIGSHGHTISLFALLGSVSEKVVRKSSKAVLVLKYPEIKK